MSWTRRLPVSALLCARAHQAEPLLTALTILAIAASVTLGTGLEMSSRSVERELQRTADELAGAASIEVTAGDVGVPEELVATVAAVPGVEVAAPLLQATFRMVGGREDGSSLHVIGVDLVADTRVRSYAFAGGRLQSSDRLRLVSGEPAAIVSSELAEALRLSEGDVLSLRSGRTPYELVIRGVLEPGGVGDAFGGRIVIVDVYALQALIGRQGWLDRIDVVAEAGSDADELMAALGERLRGQATVRRAALRDRWLDNTLGVVRLVVAGMVLVAILVASLLAHGASAAFIERRGRDLALLRTVGLESGRARRLLLVDAWWMGSLGTVLGVALGVLVSRYFVVVLSRISDFLDDVEIEQLEIEGSTFAAAAIVGLVVTLLGVVAPARRATRGAALESLRAHDPGTPLAKGREPVGWQTILLLSWLGVAVLPIPLGSAARVGILLGLGLLIVLVLAGGALPRLLARRRGALERLIPGIGRLAGASLVTQPSRTGIHIAAIAGVVAAVTVSSILSRSLASTLDYWTASLYPGGIMVTPAAGISMRSDETLEPEIVGAIRGTPGVEALFDHFAARILFRGEEVLLGAGDMAVMAEHGRLPALDRDPQELARAIAEGQIAVSDGFAARFGVGPGDRVVLESPRGPRSFEVAGVMRDYAGPGGSLNLDIRVYDELWGRPGSRDVVIWTDGPAERVIAEIERRVGERQALFFVHGDQLSRYASRVLGRFLRILDVVAMLTCILGGLAVLNLLLGAVGERRRELALLRSAGATRGQVSLLVLLDGMIAALVGGLAGLILGVVSAERVVRGVIPDALGWWLDFSVTPGPLLAMLAGVVLAALAAGIYPAALAWRVPPREVFAPE